MTREPDDATGADRVLLWVAVILYAPLVIAFWIARRARSVLRTIVRSRPDRAPSTPQIPPQRMESE